MCNCKLFFTTLMLFEPKFAAIPFLSPQNTKTILNSKSIVQRRDAGTSLILKYFLFFFKSCA